MSELEQALLGLHPFVLAEFKPSGEGDNVKVSLSFGGGISQEDVREALELVLETLPQSDPSHP